MVAGAAAEEAVVGVRSTGAINDYRQAVRAAMQIIAAGMSRLGVISPEDVPTEAMHAEIQRIIAAEQEKVRTFFSNCDDLIRELAEILVHEEKISGDLIRRRLEEEKILVA